jgi:ATP-dependent DNA helicase RecG
MTPDTLRKVLSLGESQTVEFKVNYLPEIAGREVCAFLNSGGGYLVCGVDASGAIVGVTPDRDLKRLELELVRSISPKAFLSFETDEIEGKTVLVIEVPSGMDVPYSFINDIFIRIGNGAQKADVDTIRDMILRRQTQPERWERRFSDAQMDSDLDLNHLRSVIDSIQKFGRFHFRNNLEPNLVLEDLSVMKYGRLTNAGDLLFCKNTAKRYPQVRVRAVRFTSEKTDDTYRDIKHFEGPVLQVLEDVYAFIVRNTPTRARFIAGRLERQDISLYPAEAIREGLVNAFVHRDYSDFSGGIAVQIYPDRLEIWNSGEFPAGITAQKLMNGHISVLRNPDLAHLFYLRGMMEKMGRGSVLIQKSCAEQGLPMPNWHSEKGSGVTLTLYAPEVTPEVIRLLQNLAGEMLRREIQKKLGLKDPDHFREAYINPAIKAGLIEMTISESPKSSRQRYRLTALGQLIARGGAEGGKSEQ